ncbi:MAG: hypothetical protein A2Z32_14750 [Chloroflexi bacterium RBG_16_69_14]|jgi:predicted nucleic acid-binding protein|nr:MAG: hypothetical protein A2Z32_14750 [Chloroflexi bacterium RBG_16_69_14]
MRFWDSSAIIPLLVDESWSRGVLAEYVRDPEIVVWWATPVECVSALARLERESRLTAAELSEALARLDELALAWHEVQPIDRARQIATRLLRTHGLRAADAFQLAAAISASEERAGSVSLVTLDGRLAAAADREGFRVVNPAG